MSTKNSNLMNLDTLINKVEEISSEEDIEEIINNLRILAANEKSKDVLSIIETAIFKTKFLKNKKYLVDLYELQIKQIYHKRVNLPLVENILIKMKIISTEINYTSGLALCFQIEGYVENYKGNKRKSIFAINKSMNLLDGIEETDNYIYHICLYSYAISQWFENHSVESIEYLEKCVNYFLQNFLHRSLTQTLGLLIIFYQRTQNKKKAVETSKKLFNNKSFFNKQPEDVQAMANYLAGVGQILRYNLKQAENLFYESYMLFNGLLDRSIYYTYYYIRLLSHLAMTKALQGKIWESFEKIKKIEELLENKYIIENLDEYSKNQVPHTIKLIKFYVYSRIFGYNHIFVQELREEILKGIKDNYSDSIMLGEFLLNSELNYTQLKNLQKIENASLKRVGSIIDYAIEKTKSKEKFLEERLNKYMKILKDKPSIKNLTFTEKAFGELLVAQELYSHDRLADIYQLLKKYENQVNRIEVLEMRIFIEAFIQVGKFGNKDPLAPALHFMAIKQCREHKFGRLEKILVEQQGTLYDLAFKSINIQK